MQITQSCSFVDITPGRTEEEAWEIYLPDISAAVFLVVGTTFRCGQKDWVVREVITSLNLDPYGEKNNHIIYKVVEVK